MAGTTNPTTETTKPAGPEADVAHANVGADPTQAASATPAAQAPTGPGAKSAEAMAARGEATPELYANLVKQRPDERNEIFLVLQKTLGNTFVQSVVAELESPKAPGPAPLPDSTRSKMESSFGQSFADVKMHANSSNASGSVHAMTDGTDVHFAEGKYTPGTEQGDQLIAHELAHVVQQRAGGGVAAQNFEEGAGRGMLEVDADRAAGQAATGKSANVRMRATPASRQMFDSWEHKQLGDDGGGGRTMTTKSGVTITYGDAVALSGDFYPSPDALMNAPAPELHAILDHIHQQASQAAANGGKPTETQEAAHDEAFENATMWRQKTAYGPMGAKTGKTEGEEGGVGGQSYLDLASDNNLHFSPDNIKRAWKPEHGKAMDLAHQHFQKNGGGAVPNAPGVAKPQWQGTDPAACTKPGVEPGPENTPGATKPPTAAAPVSANDLLGQAVFHDGFSCHFLTDAFASGHLISGEVGRKVGGAFWTSHAAACTSSLKAAANADFPHTPHQAVDAAVDKLTTSGSFLGKVSSLCLKLVHDKLNDTAITVTNPAGDTWQTMGDDALSKAPETQRIGAQAVQASRQAVEEMANTGVCATPERALDFVPMNAALAGSAAKPIDAFATDPAMFTSILTPLLLDSSINNPLYQLIKGNLGLATTLGKEWGGEKVNEVENGALRGVNAAENGVKEGAKWVKGLF